MVDDARSCRGLAVRVCEEAKRATDDSADALRADDCILLDVWWEGTWVGERSANGNDTLRETYLSPFCFPSRASQQWLDIFFHHSQELSPQERSVQIPLAISSMLIHCHCQVYYAFSSALHTRTSQLNADLAAAAVSLQTMQPAETEASFSVRAYRNRAARVSEGAKSQINDALIDAFKGACQVDLSQALAKSYNAIRELTNKFQW